MCLYKRAIIDVLLHILAQLILCDFTINLELSWV